MNTPRPKPSRKPATAKRKAPRSPAASKAKAKTKTRKAKPRGRVDDADVQIIEFTIPEIEGWPSMEEAFTIGPDDIELMVGLKPANPHLMRDTELKVPESLRAAYHLAANYASLQSRLAQKYQQKIESREAYDVAAMHMPRLLDEAEVQAWDASLQKDYLALMLLMGLSKASAELMIAKLVETLGIREALSFFTVTKGYSIAQFYLSPELPWRAMIPERFHSMVAYTLFVRNVNPLSLPDGVLEQILRDIEVLGATTQEPRSGARATKAKRSKTLTPKQSRPQKTVQGPVRTSAPASPTADNTAGPVMGFQLGPNAVRGRKTGSVS